jgi:hypothetical protein
MEFTLLSKRKIHHCGNGTTGRSVHKEILCSANGASDDRTKREHIQENAAALAIKLLVGANYGPPRRGVL